jgi:lipopolysaccharide export system permease protein
MPRILNGYILKQIWKPALLAAVVITFVIIAGTIQRQIAELLEESPIAQFALPDILRLSAYALPALSGYILPITFLMGILLTFGRMARQNEFIALKAAGIPLKKAVMPVIITGVVLSGLCFFIQNQGQAWAWQRMTRLLKIELPLRVTLDVLPTGKMHQYEGWRVYIGSRDRDGMLRNLMVLQPREDGEADVFYAAQAGLVRENGGAKLLMRHGYYIPAQESGKMTMQFNESRITLPGKDLSGIEPDREGMLLREMHAEERRLAALFDETQSIPVGIELRKMRIAMSERLSFPLMCLAVSLVAAPLGARGRKSGRSYAFAIGFLVIGAYFLLRKMVEPPFIPSLPQMLIIGQIPNLVLCAAGAFFVWRVDRI